MLLQAFCKLYISKDLGRISVRLHFPLPDIPVAVVPSASIGNGESNENMLDCL